MEQFEIRDQLQNISAVLALVIDGADEDISTVNY